MASRSHGVDSIPISACLKQELREGEEEEGEGEGEGETVLVRQLEVSLRLSLWW